MIIIYFAGSVLFYGLLIYCWHLGFIILFFMMQIRANTTCGFYAGKAALENGFDPKAQNGIIWDPNNYKISDIYKMYPNNRTVKPQAGTAGFVFYTNKRGTYSRYMEFYDYRYGGETYT